MNDAPLGATAELLELQTEYEILGELGRGGSAVVYRGRDRGLGREVAIKVVHPRALTADDDPVARLAREARTVAQLQHPNIVTVYAVRRLAGGGLALVMQLVPGRTLKAMVLHDGPFPVERCRQVLQDVASALAFAHSRGIIHRDVKPENIFLDEESGRALLSDFGIARSDEQDSMTRTGTAIGTPFYMSPEQIDGAAVDGRSDLYSLGLVAWEMLTGQRPWDGESLYNVIFKQKNEQLPPIEALRPGVPLRLQYVIERMLQKNPAARWAGAEGLLSQLTHSVLPGDYNRWQANLPKRVELYRVAERERARAATEAPPKGNGLLASTMRFVRGVAGSDPRTSRGAAAATGLGDTLVFQPDAEPPPVQTGVTQPAAALPTRNGRAPHPPPAAVRHVDTVQPTWEIPARRPARSTWAVGIVGVVVVATAAAVGLGGTDRWPLLHDLVASLIPGRVSEAPPFTTTPAAGPGSEASTAPTPQPSLAGPAAGTDAPRAVLAAGGRHACAVTSIGQLQCWGANERGQLGDGTAQRQRTPVAVVAALSFASVSAGTAQSCAVTNLGDIYCWGNDATGQLGDATTVRRNAPVRVAGAGIYRTVSTGDGHTCATTVEGSVDCWGANSRGQLGDGTVRGRSVPSRTVGVEGVRFTQVVVGSAHTCGLSVAGEAYCWGANDRGQLGSGNGPDRRQPTPVSGGLRFAALSAGQTHTCGVLTDGGVRCWGANGRGQLGTGNRTTSPVPVAVRLPVAAAAVTAGSLHSCALTLRGEAFCWGANPTGQLGDSSRTDAMIPARVLSGVGFAAIAAGSSHTCAATHGGEAVCWGDDVDGQLGDGGSTGRPFPGPVTFGTGVTLATAIGVSPLAASQSP